MTVSINGTNGITFYDASTQNTAATGFGFKNRLINGAMMIDQRNAGASQTPSAVASFVWTVDRWAYDGSQASKFTLGQNLNSAALPAGFSNYLGCQTAATATVGAGDYFFLAQRIEGYNAADLGWGAAGASTVTLSFWVRSSLTGTFGGSIINNALNYSYPFSYTIAAANTWTQISITITGPTAGTWLGTNNNCIEVRWALGMGSTYQGTANTWAAANYGSATGTVNVVGTLNATFYITGVQLEKGSTATSFDYRPYGTELALCQRYFEVLTGETSGVLALHWSYGGSTTNQWHYWYMKATKRAAATVTKVGGTWTNATPTIYSGVDVIAFNATGSAYINVAAGVVALTASAEL